MEDIFSKLSHSINNSLNVSETLKWQDFIVISAQFVSFSQGSVETYLRHERNFINVLLEISFSF